MNSLRFPSRSLIFRTLLCLALFLSRWLLAPRYLLTFDEVNFAFSIGHFDPRLSQPQPPGYPLFVGLLKLLSLLIPKVETVFLVAALLVSLVSLAAIGLLGEWIAGEGNGLAAVLLLLFNPPFWFAALTNPVRLCYAAGSIGVALCLWRGYRDRSHGWVIAAAAVLGISAGARPDLIITLTPLWIWVAWRMRLAGKTAALSIAAFAAAVALWLPVLLHASGGAREFLRMLHSYSDAQFGQSSLLFGASLAQAADMAWKAVVWSCFGALSWLWALPVAIRARRFHIHPFTWQFLLMCFLPGLLFYAIVHVGDPDHTLAIVPALCISGAIVIAALPFRSSSGRPLAIALCVLLNCFLFFKPITKTAKASTWTPVRWEADFIADVIEGVSRSGHQGPLHAVFLESTIGWRELTYYDPRVHVVLIEPNREGTLRARGLRLVREESRGELASLPSCGTIFWIDATARPVSSDGVAPQRLNARVSATPARAGAKYSFLGSRFVAGSEPCEENP